MIHRRKLLLKGSAFAASAPAIVRASSLLPALAATDGCTQGGGDIYPAGPSLTLKPGREFAANSWVHTRLVDNAPIDPMSATWVTEFARMMMANQGGVGALLEAYPIYVVGPDQPTSRVVTADPPGTPKADYLQSRFNAVPIPNPDTFKPQQASDMAAVIYQPSTDTLWEFWLMQKTGNKTTHSAGNSVGEWQATWGGQLNNVSQNPGWWITEPEGWKPGATATGIPILATLVTLGDLQKGSIDHPIAITLGISDAFYPSWNQPPAQRTDGGNDAPDKIPLGVIFRLPADLELESYPVLATNGGPKNVWRMMAEAMQNYGMVPVDTGGTSILFAEDTTNPPQFAGGDPFGSSPLYFPFIQFDEFPWDKMQVLKTNLVSS